MQDETCLQILIASREAGLCEYTFLLPCSLYLNREAIIYLVPLAKYREAPAHILYFKSGQHGYYDTFFLN